MKYLLNYRMVDSKQTHNRMVPNPTEPDSVVFNFEKEDEFKSKHLQLFIHNYL